MKVEVKEEKKDGEIKYPCLMKGKYTGDIVYFYEPQRGFYINNGKHYIDFNMGNHELFHGTVTLSND